MAFNYPELQAMTKEYFLPTVVDQIFVKDPILAKIKEQKKTVSGGKSFEVSIKHSNLDSGVFGVNTGFAGTTKEITNRLTMPVMGHYSEVTFDSFEEAQNSGNAAVVNLVTEKMQDLEEAMRQELLKALYEAPAAGAFQGLQHIVDDNNVFGGVDRSLADHDYLRSVVRENAATGINMDYDLLRKFFMDVTAGGSDGRNLVFVGDYTTISKIESILAGRNQITTVNQTSANLGFESFTLFGKPVYASDKLEKMATASGKGVLYALNFDYLTMHTLKGNDFRLTDFKQDRKSELRSAQLLVAGNYVATKPNRLGVIKDINLV